MNRILAVLLVIVLLLLLFVIKWWPHGVTEYEWYCRNPKKDRQGIAYNIQNCYEACDFFPKKPICCLYEGETCDAVSEKGAHHCSTSDRPFECK
jgi:hypothetical protein